MFIVLVRIGTQSYPQGTWTKKASFVGNAPRYGPVGFSIGTKGYIGTGNLPTPASCKDFWE